MSVAGVDALLADRYRLDERLAVSGTGEVWRATDTVLQRAVAVRTVRPELVADPHVRSRLRAEARHASTLSHPGIASVYDCGELEDEGAWLVVELVDGQPLSRVLQREGVLPPDQVLDLVAQTARALAIAHASSVVHRDVKPGNLLVSRDGMVKVTDFEIVSTIGTTALTPAGEAVPTAYYLSPEQAGGAEVGPASDLYSLGVVAFECLSGARPFPGPDPLAVARAHLREDPPALPDSVPAPVSRLVARLLAKDPAARHPSATALADEATALRQALATATHLATEDVQAEVACHQTATPSAPLDERLSTRTTVPKGPQDRARPGATSTDQRRVVSGISLVLVLLVLVFGLRSVLVDDTPVPTVPSDGSSDQESDRSTDRIPGAGEGAR